MLLVCISSSQSFAWALPPCCQWIGPNISLPTRTCVGEAVIIMSFPNAIIGSHFFFLIIFSIIFSCQHLFLIAKDVTETCFSNLWLLIDCQSAWTWSLWWCSNSNKLSSSTHDRALFIYQIKLPSSRTASYNRFIWQYMGREICFMNLKAKWYKSKYWALDLCLLVVVHTCDCTYRAFPPEILNLDPEGHVPNICQQWLLIIRQYPPPPAFCFGRGGHSIVLPQL